MPLKRLQYTPQRGRKRHIPDPAIIDVIVAIYTPTGTETKVAAKRLGHSVVAIYTPAGTETPL